MWRYRLLKGYALVVGAVLFVLGLAGLLPPPLSPFGLDLPENLLHIGAGSLFIGGVLLFHDLNHLRGFVLGMGILLVAGKSLLITTNWTNAPYHTTVVGVICLVSGLGSVLVAALAKTGTPPPPGE